MSIIRSTMQWINAGAARMFGDRRIPYHMVGKNIRPEMEMLEDRLAPARVVIDAVPPQVVVPGQQNVLLSMFHVTGGTSGRVRRVDFTEVFGTTATENIRSYQLWIDAFGTDSKGRTTRGGDGTYETSILLFVENDAERSIRFNIGGPVASLHPTKPAFFMLVGNLETVLSGSTIGVDLTGLSTIVNSKGNGNPGAQRYFHAPPAIHTIANNAAIASFLQQEEEAVSPFEAALSPF